MQDSSIAINHLFMIEAVVGTSPMMPFRIGVGSSCIQTVLPKSDKEVVGILKAYMQSMVINHFSLSNHYICFAICWCTFGPKLDGKAFIDEVDFSIGIDQIVLTAKAESSFDGWRFWCIANWKGIGIDVFPDRATA